jgi:hypothetical protein
MPISQDCVCPIEICGHQRDDGIVVLNARRAKLDHGLVGHRPQTAGSDMILRAPIGRCGAVT